MTSNDSAQPVTIALTLSGGGFRASLFHLGVLRRLAEAGWLGRIDVLSTVSGGSIVGAFAALRWQHVMQDGGGIEAFDRHVIEPFTELIRDRSFIHAWGRQLALLPFRKLRNRHVTRTDVAASLFGTWFYNNLLCTALPERPFLVMNATNLISGRAWRFTRDGMGDSRVGYSPWKAAALSVGVGVAASAGFPPVFPPTRIPTAAYSFGGKVYATDPDIPLTPFIPLSDGGVYENMGIEAVIKKQNPLPTRILAQPEFLVASDAGYPPQARFRASGLPALAETFLLYRVDEIARDQVGALRRRMLVEMFRAPGRFRGALLVLGSSIDKVPNAAPNWCRQRYIDSVGADAVIPAALVRRIHSIRTHLNAFTSVECEALMYHGYTLADAVLWAHEDQCAPAFRLAHPGAWRIRFDEATVDRWSKGLAA